MPGHPAGRAVRRLALVSLNLAVVLRETARARPGKVAVILDEFRLTYDHLDALSNQVAGGLRSAGVAPGDRVALLLPNVPQLPIAYYGVLKAGAVVVPVNGQVRAPEIAHVLRDCGARCLIAWHDLPAEAMQAAEQAGDVQTYVVQRPGAGGQPEGGLAFTQLLRGSPGTEIAATDPGDTAAVLYTAGTTGPPRGAELTHLNLLVGCLVAASRLVGAGEEDVALAATPLADAFTQCAIMNAVVSAGGTLTLAPRFDPEHVLEVIRRDRVTLLCAAPAAYTALLHQPETAPPRSLRRCCAAGGALPAGALAAVEARLQAPVLEAFGLAEAVPAVTVSAGPQERRPDGAGLPVWGLEVAIGDAGDDRVGEVLVRGHGVMKGYLGRPEATAEALRGGWLHTGDLGRQDEDGHLFVVDRLADLIVRGGRSVYPRQVETALGAHPAGAAPAGGRGRGARGGGGGAGRAPPQPGPPGGAAGRGRPPPARAGA